MIFLSMDYDVAIIGGAFSGAATALVLKRRFPNARIDRKSTRLNSSH